MRWRCCGTARCASCSTGPTLTVAAPSNLVRPWRSLAQGWRALTTRRRFSDHDPQPGLRLHGLFHVLSA
jgi:hypothetical protein